MKESVTASRTVNGVEQTVSVEYDFGATLRKSVELFGDAAVHRLFLKGAKSDLRAEMERLLQGGKGAKNAMTPGQVMETIATYLVGQDKKHEAQVAKAAKVLGSLTKEALAEALATVGVAPVAEKPRRKDRLDTSE